MSDDPIFEFIMRHFSKIWIGIFAIVATAWIAVVIGFIISLFKAV